MNNQKQLTALVVDDEPLARQYLLGLLEGFEQVAVVGGCKNGLEAVRAVKQHGPDLLFLDIQMPKLDGFEVLELLETAPLAVVFTTAYEQYALRAFDAHAVDYLLKPFSTERLGAAIDKVMRNLGSGVPAVEQMKAAAGADPYLARVVVRDGSRIEVVAVDQIRYICAEDDYVEIHHDGGSLLKHQTLQKMADALDPARFVRIHRSAVVNLERVVRIELLGRDRVVAVMDDGASLRISRAGHKRLRAVMG